MPGERRPLDFEAIKKNAPQWKDGIGLMQVAVYVMAGGGLIGRLAAEQPADFYVDTRVSRRPYGLRDLSRAVKVLAVIADANGLNPHNMPKMPNLHNLAIF